MAVAGPDYECVYADVGTNGRVSDGVVWNNCGLIMAIEVGTVILPPPKCLPFGVQKLPYVFVGDDAFALNKHMMKPYPQHDLTEDKRVYNYRHSRARRISENPFWYTGQQVASIQICLAAATRHHRAISIHSSWSP